MSIVDSIDPALSREEVLAQTGSVVAVKDVSFSVREGETFVIMGLSGSGKSTLVRCLSRLIEPTRGEVLIDGQDVLAMNKQELRDIRRHTRWAWFSSTSAISPIRESWTTLSTASKYREWTRLSETGGPQRS